MTLQEAMKTLGSMGTGQNRKVYARHGAGDRSFGVSFANIGKLTRTIGTDHALASQLWATGNADARTLATMVADPKQATSEDLDVWVNDIQYYPLADLLARYVVSKSPFARKKMEQWTKSKQDYVGQAGWDVLAILAMNDSGIADSYFERTLSAIEKRIPRAPNRTRHAMNNALIAIGMRTPALRKLALAAAGRIGKVHVDHGETNCKTPDAASYIRKAAARQGKRK